ncbi:hypothetical protein [Vibrio sp. AK197]
MAIAFILFNPIPLIVCIPLLSLLLDTFLSSRPLGKPLVGACYVAPHQLKFGERNYRIKETYLNYKTWLVVLELEDGQRYCLWRDSVSEQHYRQLLVMLQNSTPNKKATDNSSVA